MKIFSWLISTFILLFCLEFLLRKANYAPGYIVNKKVLEGLPFDLNSDSIKLVSFFS
jgi:hypothetical protein